MTLERILGELPGLSALVAGDICLDRWCTYDPSAAEPSRETGIPRIGVVSTDLTPGAGGTVAANLASLGVGRVAVLGVTGDDGFAFELRAALSARRIESDLLVRVPGPPTFTYTKLLNRATGAEDLPRVDFISGMALAPGIEAGFLDRLRAAVPEFDVVLIADQAETGQGAVVTPAVRALASELARRFPEKVFWADSRMRPELFRGVIVKPNRREAESACLRLFGAVDFQRLRRYAEAPLLVVTAGPEGALLVDDAGERWVRTRPVAGPVDICGAGDSFSAGAAAALRLTRSADEAARFGNLVASVTIMKRGTGTASPSELLEADARPRN